MTLPGMPSVHSRSATVGDLFGRVHQREGRPTALCAGRERVPMRHCDPLAAAIALVDSRHRVRVASARHLDSLSPGGPSWPPGEATPSAASVLGELSADRRLRFFPGSTAKNSCHQICHQNHYKLPHAGPRPAQAAPFGPSRSESCHSAPFASSGAPPI
jgi:hypothetical protein